MILTTAKACILLRAPIVVLVITNPDALTWITMTTGILRTARPLPNEGDSALPQLR